MGGGFGLRTPGLGKHAREPDLVVFGAFVVDDIVREDGATRAGLAGGSVLYASLAAAHWGARCGAVGRVGSDYPDEAMAWLRRRGVDVSHVKPLERAGPRVSLFHEDSGRRVVPRSGAARLDEVAPRAEDVPAAWRAARAFHLTPMPLAIQRELVDHLRGRSSESAGAAEVRGGSFISIDPHDAIRDETLEAWRRTLARVDMLFVAEGDLRLGDAADPPLPALRRLAGGRLRYVALKRAARGGLLWDVDRDSVTPWEAPATTLVDPTGAGDAFAGGFLASWIAAPGDVRRALDCGAASAAAAVSGWGPEGVLGLET